MARQADEPQSPSVHFPPPILFVIAIIAGWAIESWSPLPLSSLILIPAQPALGWVFIIAGTALMLWGLVTFRIAKTAVYPNRPAQQLVAQGPYRFSRNPMYVGLTIMTIGIGFLADNIWMLFMLPVVLSALSKLVIQREEKYLQHAFGSSYTDYQKRVRRWI